MNAIKIRTLETTDVAALLAFEVENREWFERHIDARDAAFYSVQGVTEHIAAYLCDHAAGTWHPFVIEGASREIIGRANLKDIDTCGRVAEVGYRIAERACGQGLATLAVKHLIEQAQLRWNLEQLVANVYADNIGSAKVLERCGFSIEPDTRQDGINQEIRFGLSIEPGSHNPL